MPKNSSKNMAPLRKLTDSQQHAQAIFALAIVAMCYEYFEYPDNGFLLQKQLERVKALQYQAGELTRKKKMYSGGKRKLTRSSHIFCEELNLYRGDLTKCAGISWWSAWPLVIDAIALCPAYASGKEWRALAESVEALCVLFQSKEPEVEGLGTQLYEKITLV